MRIILKYSQDRSYFPWFFLDVRNVFLYSIYMDENVVDSSKPAKKYPTQGGGNKGGNKKFPKVPVKQIRRHQKRG